MRIVEHLLAGDIHIVYNAQIIREYEEVLSRPKFRIGYDKVTLLLDFVKRYGLTSLPKSYAGEMPDESDRVFYEITLGVDDSFLVTGNLKHYPVTPQVVTPAQMIEIIES